jgi:predicted glycoside hydrolase/deacetylase ChbG (UPF0249 family)
MKKTIGLLSLWLILISSSILPAQTKTVAERLGYAHDAKLLILHADDIGLANSVNTATIKAFEADAINSGSIMVPCPWFPEIAGYAVENPKYDFGLHLTLTAEWKNFRWGGVLPPAEIPSLLDENGFLYATSEAVAKNADPVEVEKEIDAQVQRALAFGVTPTHLDSHMGSLFTTPELFQVYLKVGAKYNLPVFIPLNAAQGYPELMALLDGKQIPVDNFYMMEANLSHDEWTGYYKKILEQLKPGLNEIIVHLAIDNAEMQAVAVDHPDYGSAWRENDLQAMLSEEFKASLAENDIKLVTWGQIKTLLESQ